MKSPDKQGNSNPNFLPVGADLGQLILWTPCPHLLYVVHDTLLSTYHDLILKRCHHEILSGNCLQHADHTSHWDQLKRGNHVSCYFSHHLLVGPTMSCSNWKLHYWSHHTPFIEWKLVDTGKHWVMAIFTFWKKNLSLILTSFWWSTHFSSTTIYWCFDQCCCNFAIDKYIHEASV